MMVLTAPLQRYVAGFSKAESQCNFIEVARGSEVSFDVGQPPSSMPPQGTSEGSDCNRQKARSYFVSCGTRDYSDFSIGFSAKSHWLSGLELGSMENQIEPLKHFISAEKMD
jgi:hypothetical protein